MNSASDHIAVPRREAFRPSYLATMVEFVLILAVFFVGAGGVPPAVNEAHYLARARHFWNPAWCAGDLFLESRETHVTFVILVGWLTQYCTLETTAWIGRFAAWSLLAAGWTYLVRCVSARRGTALFTSAMAVVLWAGFHMAGEWVVDGVEAKVFAYGFVLFALGALLRGNWRATGVLLGAATALHAVVGSWAAVVCAGVYVWEPADERTPFHRLWPSLVAGGVLAAVGIAPALMMNADADFAQRTSACQLQVFRRLPHHLLLLRMHPLLIARHLILWSAWVWRSWADADDPRLSRLHRTVWVSLGLALAGTALSLGSLWFPAITARLLRFYWFRMTDVLPAVAVAVSCGAWLARNFDRANQSPRSSETWRAAALLCFVSLGVSSIFLVQHRDRLPGAVRQGSPAKARRTSERWQRFVAWRQLCRWVREYTPASALVLTPSRCQTFKWYAERPELVNWKDMPQDAVSLIEWQQRLRAVDATGIFDRNHVTDESRLDELARKYGIDFIVTPRRQVPLALFPVVFRNDAFEVYRVPRS